MQVYLPVSLDKNWFMHKTLGSPASISATRSGAASAALFGEQQKSRSLATSFIRAARDPEHRRH